MTLLPVTLHVKPGIHAGDNNGIGQWIKAGHTTKPQLESARQFSRPQSGLEIEQTDLGRLSFHSRNVRADSPPIPFSCFEGTPHRVPLLPLLVTPEATASFPRSFVGVATFIPRFQASPSC